MEYALVLLWFVAFQALAFAALPVASRLFSGFPDRGAAFALPIALTVVTMVGYWVGHVAFGRWTAFLGVAVLVGLSLVAHWTGSTTDSGDEENRASHDLPLRAYAETTLIFALAFGLLVAVRAVDPSVHPGGGEKFLDYGILKSLMRAQVLPPQDMWWAGDHILYYYGGHLASALLNHLTGTEARFGYNLALSGFYAMLVTSAYGLAGAIANARGASRRTGGALGAFFVGFGSNLVTPVTGAIWLLPDSIASGLGNWVGVQLAGHRPNDSDIYSAEILQEGLDAFGYWGPSRVIPRTINEFPLFSFLNGDLHAHMVSTPFLLLIAAFGFAYFQSGPRELGRRRLLAFGVFPLVVGLLGLVNVWSFPTGLGVVWLALLFAPADPSTLFPGISPSETAEPVANGSGNVANGSGNVANGSGSVAGEEPKSTETERGPSLGATLVAEARRLAGAFAAAGVVGALAILWVAPFVFGILLRSAGNRSIAFWPDPASAVGLLLVHGAFLAVFAAFLWPRARAAFDVDAPRFVALSVGVVGFAWLVGYPVLALVVPLLIIGWLLLRTREGDWGYETVLLIGGAGLVTLVEFVYIQDSAAGGRFNTVFKVYMQVWVLWATAAGAALSALVASTGPSEWRLSVENVLSSDGSASSDESASSGGSASSDGSVSPDGGVPSLSIDRRTVMSVFALLLVVSSGLYGGLALNDHFTSEFHRLDDPTLDGTAFVADDHPEEAAAIHWLDDREGQPHIVSAPGQQVYSWTSPAASLTGLPTVVGWVYHEGIYRGHETSRQRVADVDLIYTGTWADRAELLKTYDVEYIYVGPHARDRYDDANLDFAEFPGIEEAFSEDGVVVYRVNHSEL